VSDPNGPEELARRLHTAIQALDPDIDFPLTENPTGATANAEAAAALGYLMAMCDYWASTIPTQGMDILADVYARTNYPTSDAVPGPADIHRTLSARLELTGKAAALRTGEGTALVIGGACAAARAAAQMMIELDVAAADRPSDEPFPAGTIDRMNAHLLRAQEHFDLVRAGFGRLAEPYGGMPDGVELHSEDPRITRILDRGTTMRIEYQFQTPDGPLSKGATAPLEGIAELIGLDPEERRDMLVRMAEGTIGDVEAQALGHDPDQNG
jgi:hypothetical protein